MEIELPATAAATTTTHEKKEEEHKRITEILNERLEVHDESKEKVPKADFNKPCGGLRAQTNEYEEEGQQGGSRGGRT